MQEDWEASAQGPASLCRGRRPSAGCWDRACEIPLPQRLQAHPWPAGSQQPTPSAYRGQVGKGGPRELSVATTLCCSRLSLQASFSTSCWWGTPLSGMRTSTDSTSRSRLELTTYVGAGTSWGALSGQCPPLLHHMQVISQRNVAHLAYPQPTSAKSERKVVPSV